MYVPSAEVLVGILLVGLRAADAVEAGHGGYSGWGTGDTMRFECLLCATCDIWEQNARYMLPRWVEMDVVTSGGNR